MRVRAATHNRSLAELSSRVRDIEDDCLRIASWMSHINNSVSTVRRRDWDELMQIEIENSAASQSFSWADRVKVRERDV
jgi:hypothetical protein